MATYDSIREAWLAKGAGSSPFESIAEARAAGAPSDLRGIHRLGTSSSYEHYEIPAGAPAINATSGFTILVEFLFEAEDTAPIMVEWGVPGGGGDKRYAGAYLVSTTGNNGELRLSLRRGGTNENYTGPEITDARDGSTRIIAALSADTSGNVAITHIPDGGTIDQDTFTGAHSLAGVTSNHTVGPFRRVSWDSPSTRGVLEAYGFDVVLSTSQLQAIADAGSPYAWGARTHSDMVWSFRPATSMSDGETIDDVATEIVDDGGDTWAVYSGTADHEAGGF